MTNVLSSIQQTLTDSVRMSILQNTKHTTMFETILYSIIISALTYLTQYATDLWMPLSRYRDSIRGLFLRKYILCIDGKTCTTTSAYSVNTRVTTIYSDNFKAVWSYILKSLPKNESIYEIREVANTYRIRLDDEMQDVNPGMYIVSQREQFLLDADLEIYATTTQTNEHVEEKAVTRTNKIEITLYSYKSNANVLKQYVETLTSRYLSELSDSRNNKRFLYSLLKPDTTSDTFTLWRESEFHSSKTFQNVFFENKQKIVDQIDFFLKNREWYDTYGIPYTLGIGLYGPPGTGKTSFIKALMNHLGDRHLVNMPLSLIKTKTQLQEYYYESRFTDHNKPNSVGFDKKLIVIEDIDCASDIVMERKTTTTNPPNMMDECHEITLNDHIQTFDKEIQKTVKENIVAETQKLLSKMSPPIDDRITLDDVLNLWDGIRETPGRILIITSNHYDKLDTAIRRPGRIDITLGLENASRETIAEMFFHFYKKPIDPEILSKIESRLYSPAEIVNIYTSYKTDDVGFCERLAMNKKL